jgi:uncharacterized protein (TIGR03663 family)
MNKKAFTGLFLLIVIAAAAFRLIDLGVRPMHHDEANQALKFGALLEGGEYRYDKADHHGPSLYYLSLPFARLLGRDTLAALDERTLRLVPAGFGLGAILLLFLLVPLMGKERVLWSALGLALSPVMVYFSRFYIQETLLLFFLAGFIVCVWRHRLKPSWGWATAAGVCAGMMYATKETSVITFAAVAAAWLLARLITGKEGGSQVSPRNQRISKEEKDRDEGSGNRRGIPAGPARSKVCWGHLIVGVAAAVFVSVLLFTSFFQNPRGFLDSLLSFRVYFVKAGEAGFHLHPWSYYLRMLAFSEQGGGPVWSEALILALALVGMIAAFKLPSNKTSRPFLIFLSFYTVVSTAVYSLIPYKTPWNILPFYLGFILLAGSGAATLLCAFPNRLARAAAFLLLAAGFAHLGAQARRGSFVYPADTRNPYVYAQTSPGFLKLVRRVDELAAIHPDHEKMLVKVIAGPYETWPLPWYLRRFDRVGYWTSADQAGAAGEAAVIITDTEQAGRLEPDLNTQFQSEYYELRPGVFLVLHVRNDLWDDYLNSRTGK